MELADVLVLLDRFDGSAADRLELEADGWKLRLRKGAAKAVGVVTAPFVSAGDRVSKGQTLCVLEAMKMMSEVLAPADGTILEVLVKDGELVGFDTPLFRIKEQ